MREVAEMFVSSRITLLVVAILLWMGVGPACAEEPTRVLIEKAQALLRKEDFGNAKPLLEKAEAQLRGKETVEYATALALLGRAQAETDQAAPAVTNIGRALDILRMRRAPEPVIASAEYALARAHLRQRHLAEAGSILERIVERASTNKAAAPRAIVASALGNLGRIALEKEEWQRGQGLLLKALPLLEAEFGRKDRRLTPVLNDLGLAADRLKQVDASAAYFVRSFLIAVTGGSLEYNGRRFLSGGQAELAYSYLQQALPLVEAEYGTSLRLLDLLDALTGAAIALKKFPEAEAYLLRRMALAEVLVGKGSKRVNELKSVLGKLYLILQRYDDAVSILEPLVSSLEAAEGPGAEDTVVAACDLAHTYLELQRWANAKPLVEKLVSLAAGSEMPNVERIAHNFHMLGGKLGGLGLYSEASELLRRSVAMWERIAGEASGGTIDSLGDLAFTYRGQHRLEDAERVALRALALVDRAEIAGISGDPNIWRAQRSARLWNNLGQTYREQGEKKRTDAEEAYRRALPLVDWLVQRDPANKARYLRDKATYLGNLSSLLFVLNRDREAVAAAEEAVRLDETTGRAINGAGAEVLTLMLEALAAKRYGDAETLILRGIAAREREYGPDYPELIPLLSFLHYARTGLGKTQEAYDASKRAADILIRRASRSSLPQYSETLEADYVEAYAVHVQSAYLLAQQAAASLPALRDEAFGMAQRRIASQTASALLQAVSRQAEGAGPLGGLIRERQDRLVKITALERSLGSELGRPRSSRNEKEETGLRQLILEGRTRVAELDAIIARDFPRFADLGSQQPVPIEKAQGLLADNEALVLIVSDKHSQKTFAWALTRAEAAWVEIPIRSDEIPDFVHALRCGLDEEEWVGTTRAARCGQYLGLTDALGDDHVLPFDVDLAHDLYLSLFEPFHDLIKGRRLLIVASGPLTSLPFHVLVTEKPETPLPATFEGYRDVAWLAKSHAVTVLPSVTSLYALRAQSAKRQKAPQDYIGIGNPVLKGTPGECRNSTVPDTCPTVERAGKRPEFPVASAERATIRGGNGRRNAGRSLRQVYAAGREAGALLKQVRSMCPLPDTDYELRCVAERFPQGRYDLLRDRLATETGLRKLNADGALARYRIVHFATHGLVAGDVETTAKRQGEPALVLTPPDQPVDADDDGLLTASEVAQLKLNADWVVLSACSTAAGDGANAEALSGLARAFFYAGTRALLVSHWPVYSDAAVQLTTRTFAELDREPAIGRAEAFQRAMIALMDDRSLPSNAHPAVWAPFVVVGEGGRD